MADLQRPQRAQDLHGSLAYTTSGNENDRIMQAVLAKQQLFFFDVAIFHLLHAVAETQCDNAALCREVSLLQRSNMSKCQIFCTQPNRMPQVS